MSTNMVCNCCGKSFAVLNEIPQEDFLHIKKQWGYFSKRDGMIHEFLVCEECYEKWLENFVIPPDEKQATELL